MFCPFHFEIPCDNPERAIAFYTDLFGWEIRRWENCCVDYWVVATSPERDMCTVTVHGGLRRRIHPLCKTGIDTPAFVWTLDIPLIQTCLEKIPACGGTIVMSKFDEEGRVLAARCKDTEGNVFELHQAAQVCA